MRRIIIIKLSVLSNVLLDNLCMMMTLVKTPAILLNFMKLPLMVNKDVSLVVLAVSLAKDLLRLIA